MKKIHELLDIDDEQEVVVEPVDESTALTIGGVAAHTDDAEDIQLEADFEDALDNIKDVIEIAKTATNKIASIAADTEDDKDFNALNALLKTTMDASEKMVTLYTRKIEYKEKKRKIIAPAGEDMHGNTFHIDKAVFTGTLDTLDTAINMAQKKEGS